MDWLTHEQILEEAVNRSELPDGGGIEDNQSPFYTTADVETNWSEHYRAVFDEYVIAPFRIMWEDLRARVGFGIVVFYILVGTIGVMLIDAPSAGTGPLTLGAFQTLEFPLGTTGTGKGLLALTVHSTTPILKMIIAGALFSTIVATIWGTFAGYKGGTVDQVMMTVSDIVMSVPGLPLVIVLAAILQPKSPYVIGIILSLHVWAGFSRELRSQVLTIRENSYIEASRTMGVSTPRIVLKDILPNMMPYISVNFVTSARQVIISSVALYFLGVLPQSVANWGTTMTNAYNNGVFYGMGNLNWFLVPLFSLVLLSLGLILLGQGLDRIFNPRIRARHTKSVDTDEEDSTVNT